MGLTAQRLKELDLVDEIIPEPLGGAHRDIDAVASSLKHALIQSLDNITSTSIDKLLDQRYEHLMAYGNYSE